MTFKIEGIATHQSKGICSMYRPDAYPTNDKDPRLENVADKFATLTRQIDNAEWDDKPVTKAQRDKLFTLKQQMRDGKLWTPKF